jgi:hypothetical protein
MKYLISFLHLFIVTTLSAQNITGYVKDASGNPIGFANVVLLQDSTFLNGTATDENGYFCMGASADTLSHIRVSILGYSTYVGKIPEDGNCGTIVLDENTVLLKEAVVNGHLPTTRLSGNGMITSVAHSILASAGTASDVLSKVPLVMENNGAFTVFGRGTPDIYINGRLIRDASELERLSSKDISSVEVITNPGAQYSAETKAVIRIKTLPPKGDGFSVTLYNSTQLTHYILNNDHALLKYRWGGWEMFADGYFYGGKYRERSVSDITTYSPILTHQAIDSRSTLTRNYLFGRTGFNYQKGNHSWGAYYQSWRSKTNTHGGILTDITRDDAPYLSLSQNVTGKKKERPNHDANIYYVGTVGNLSIDFNGNYLYNKKYKTETQTEHGESTTEKCVYTDNNNNNSLWAEKLVLSYPLLKGTLDAGEEWTHSRVNDFAAYDGANIYGGDTHIKEKNLAGFLELSQDMGNFQYGVGLRFKHVRYQYFEADQLNSDLSRTYNNWFPTLSASAKIKQWQLSFDFTGRTRRPTYQQLDGTTQYVTPFTYESGRPSLTAVKVYTAQLMAQWRIFYAQALYNHERSSIFNVTERYHDDPLVKLITYQNVPKYRYFLLTLGAQPHIGCWSPQISGLLFFNIYTTQVLERMKHLRRPLFSLNWNNTLSLPHSWKVDADFMYRTSGYQQNVDTRAVSYLNLSITKTMWKNRLSVRLKANDIFDASHERNILYNGDLTVDSRDYDETRSLVLTIQYDLNVTHSKYRGTGAGQDEKSRF